MFVGSAVENYITFCLLYDEINVFAVSHVANNWYDSCFFTNTFGLKYFKLSENLTD